MRRRTMSKWGLLALLLMATVTCGEAPFVAAPGSTLTVFANPPFIVANGGVSVISALVIEPAGTPAPNGTVVQFFTTLGSIEPQGETRNGVARVNLVADSRSGTAQVTAASGDQTVAVEGGVVIGSANPDLVVVTADPLRITSGSHSWITANVFDVDGNPIANIPVIFTLSGGTGRETLDSGGVPQFTDTNGQAFDILRTSAGSGLTGTVTVNATAANGAVGSVRVGVNTAASPPPP
jgi:hypothetical protein